MVEALEFMDINVMFTKRIHIYYMFWRYMCICTLKHSVRCQGFPSDNRGFVYQLYNWKQDFKDDVGHPTSPWTKKTPSQATVGFSENEVSILFCYWAACVCLSMAGGQETHTHTINNDI